jgi:integral membrane protein (TIGR00529 family)
MHLLFDISPLIKLMVIFGLIILFIKLRLSLGTALSGGSIFLGLWFGLSPVQVGVSVLGSLISERTVTLFAVVGLILVLSHSMEKTGQMKRLLDSFKGISHNARLNLALFPALIGLLPMPGGAIFSAPMVHEIGNQEIIDAEHKALINYWFRHIWEFSWPLYPGVILTCALSGVALWKFALVQLPLTLFAACVGYVTRLRSIPIREHDDATDSNRRPLAFIKELMPIVLVVVGAPFLGALIYLGGNALPLSTSIRREIPLIAALIISVFWVWKTNRLGGRAIQGILFNRSLLFMIFMIAGIMIFQGMLEDTGAVSQISELLARAQVPFILVIVALPFFVGTITGVTVAFVGTTFPIIFGLLANAGMTDQILAYTVLAFCAGYLGVLLSPLHACLVLSCAYFKTDLAAIYPKLSVSCLALAAAGLLSFWINQLI